MKARLVAVGPASALALALALAACNPTTELSLEIRLPDDHRLLQAVHQVNLSATRDGVLLAQRSFAATSASVSLAGVSYGARTVLGLDGVDAAGQIIARGRTCPVDFEGSGHLSPAPLYFAPTNFFAPTATAPLTPRQRPVALARADGSVLIVGGSDGAGAVYGSTESFAPGLATFAASAIVPAQARWRAEAVTLPSVGLLITGGLDAKAQTIALAELFHDALGQFLPVADARLDARVGHRVVVLADGRAFLSGGSNSDGGAPLATTLLIYVRPSDGTYQVNQGRPLFDARREHAATVALGVPMVFGGYGADGKPLDSIEIVDPASASTTPAPVIARLTGARAEATASLLADGSILLVGGVGSDGAPLGNAELYNPITRMTTLYAMASARHGHSATVLSDGRVLVAGGFGADGKALASVVLFSADTGFLTERSLITARAGHLAIPLCDGTLLIVGGAPAAELYTEPVN